MNEVALCLWIDANDEGELFLQLEMQTNNADGINEYPVVTDTAIAIDDRLTRRLEDFGKCRRNPYGYGNVSSVHSLNQQLEWEESIGIEIYRTFFPGNIGKTFEDFLNLLHQEKIHILTLLISSPIALILDIPFEIMQKGNTLPFSLSHERFYLSRSIEAVLPGFGEPEVEPLAPPLKMLFVSALPVDLSEEDRLIELEKEQERLMSAIGELISKQKVVVEFLDIATLTEIEKSLKVGQHHVVHFSGHGSHIELSSGVSGVLYLEDEWGSVKAVTGQELAQSLKKFPSIRLVVLSACESACADDAGVAGALMKNGIPAVIGMRYPVDDKTATDFTSQFYKYICAGESLGYAMFQARKTLYNFEMEKIKKQQKEDPESAVVLEWMTPFLYQVQNIHQLIDHSKEPTDTGYFFQKPESLVKGGKYVGKGFVGRHRELLGLHRLFREGKHCVCIYGQGGTGKTTLAIRFADNFENGTYQIIQFIGEVTEETILTELAKEASKYLGDQIKETIKSSDYDSITKLNLLTADFLSRQKVIILLDNFEENQIGSIENGEKKIYQREINSPSLKAFLTHLCQNPGSSSHILFTTRYLFMEPAVASLNLGEMRFSDTFKLINRFMKLVRLSNDQKHQVHQKLGGHPRALELLDRCISHEDIGWESVSKKFQEVENEEINHDLLLDMLWEQLSVDEQNALLGASVFRGLTAQKGLMAVTGQEREIIRQSIESLNTLSLLYMEVEKFYTPRLTATFVQRTKMNEKQVRNFHMKAGEYFNGSGDEIKEDVENYLEARWHLMRAEEWDRASEITCDLIEHLTMTGYHLLAFELLTEILDKDIDGRNLARVYHLLGILHSDFGNYEQALKQYEKSIEIDNKIGDSEGVSYSLHQMGIIYQIKGDYELAKKQYEKSMELFKKIGYIEGVSSSLSNIGTIYQDKGDYDEAIKKYEKSMEISEKIGDIKGVSDSLHNIGNIYYLKGDFEKALNQYEKSMEIRDEIGDIEGISDGLHQIGVIHQVKGDYELAIKKYEKSMEISEKIGDIKGVLSILNNIGTIYQDKSDYDEALKQYKKSMEISEKIGYTDGVAASLLNIGNIYHFKGDNEQAINQYKKSMEIKDKIGDIKGVSDCLHQLGTIYQNKGDYDQALMHYEKSMKIKEKIGDIKGFSLILHNIGNIYQLKGNYDQAIKQYKKSMEIKDKIGDTNGVSSVLHSMGILYRDIGDYDHALKLFEKSLGIGEKIGDIKGISDSLYQIGIIYHYKEDYDKALERYKKTLDISEKIGNVKGVSNSLGQMGMLYHDKGDYDRALNQYKKSMKIYEKIGDIKGIATSLHAIGRVYQDKGYYDQALTQYEEALEMSDKTGDILIIASCYGQMGILYFDIKDYCNALNFLIMAFLIFSKLGSPNLNITEKYILKVKEKISEELFSEILNEFNLSTEVFDAPESLEVQEKAFQEVLASITYNAAFVVEKNSEEKERIEALLKALIEKLPDTHETEELKSYLQMLLAYITGENYMQYMKKIPKVLTEMFEKACGVK